MRLFSKYIIVFFCVIFLPGNVLADFQKTKIAILPFNLQGEDFETDDMGTIVSEWLITAFVQDGRFEVIERKLLGEIFEEQQMIQSGIVTQEIAAEIGKLLGVKVIVSGSVMKLRNTIEVNARIIDVGNASIVTANNVRSSREGNLQELVVAMADKIIKDFPLDGYIANRSGNKVVIDLGQIAGVKPGMLFKVYKEGEIIRHPKTNEVLSVKQVQTGIIEITSVQHKISEGVIVKETAPGSIEYGDFATSLKKETAPIQRKEYSVKQEPVTTVAIVKKTTGVVNTDGVFQAFDTGIVLDRSTGLEWFSGPDKDINWDNARQWVGKLTVDKGGWRMPTLSELKTLYEKGKGERNITPLLQMNGWWVWSGQEKGFSKYWYLSFRQGRGLFLHKNVSGNCRVLAVRSSKSK